MYGPPAPPVTEDPLELILWENVAYLANDDRRAAAFELLRAKIGTRPEKILKAPASILLEIGKHGIMGEMSAAKMRDIAETALAEFGGDLRQAARGPLAQARKAMKRFPGIGDPGADKILLFSRSHPVFAVDSNGCRSL